MSADSAAVVSIDPALGPAKVAELLSVTPHHLWRLRQKGAFPEPDLELPGRPGANPRWRASTVQRWLDEQQAATTRRGDHDGDQ